MSGTGPDYGFLNDYISKIIDGSNKVDKNILLDDNSFYDIPSDEDNTSDGYGLDSQDNSYLNNDDSSETDDNSPSNENSNSDLYSEYPYLDPLGGSEYKPNSNDLNNINSIPSSLGSEISDNESQGDYKAFNSKGGGKGAVGKYQFRWSQWGDSIKEVTGVKNDKEFLNSPKAQEKYYAWYEKNYLIPTAKTLQKYNKKNLSLDQLAKLVHFRGEGGAKKYLTGKQSDKPESYNMSTSKYIAERQTGGIAITPDQQYNGLNNKNYDHMFFPMEGINEFRGLDDGTPVEVIDETGKKKILKGKKHKIKMKGNVLETRLK